ncbi:unnamed protein product, partial [Cyprideis torosa]
MQRHRTLLPLESPPSVVLSPGEPSPLASSSRQPAKSTSRIHRLRNTARPQSSRSDAVSGLDPTPEEEDEALEARVRASRARIVEGSANRKSSSSSGTGSDGYQSHQASRKGKNSGVVSQEEANPQPTLQGVTSSPHGVSSTRLKSTGRVEKKRNKRTYQRVVLESDSSSEEEMEQIAEDKSPDPHPVMASNESEYESAVEEIPVKPPKGRDKAKKRLIQKRSPRIDSESEAKCDQTSDLILIFLPGQPTLETIPEQEPAPGEDGSDVSVEPDPSIQREGYGSLFDEDPDSLTNVGHKIRNRPGLTARERRQRLFELVADVAVEEQPRLVVPEEAPPGVRRSKRKRAINVNHLAGDKVIRKYVTSENGTFLETVGVERGNFQCWDMRFMRLYTDGNLKAQKLLAPMKRIHKDSRPAFDNEDLEDHVSIPTTGNDGVE